MQTHQDSTSPTPQQPESGKKRRRVCSARACQNCARSKQRCDGELHCGRCRRKDLTCLYPPTRPRKTGRKTESQARNEQSQRSQSPRSGRNIDPTDPTVLSTGPVVASLQNCSALPALSDAGSANGSFPQLSAGTLRQTSDNPIAKHSLGPATTDGIMQRPITTGGSQNSPCGGISELPDEWFNVDELGGSGTDPASSALTPSYPTESFDMDFWSPDTSLSSLAPSGSTSLVAFTHPNAGQKTSGPNHVVYPDSPTATVGSNVAVQRHTGIVPLQSNYSHPTNQWEGDLCNRRSSSTLSTGAIFAGLKEPGARAEAWKLEDFGNVPRLRHDTYNSIVTGFAILNSDNGCHLPHTTIILPSLTEMNAFIQVYFEEFHPVFPLLHQPTFDPNRDNWVLALALAATGCRFSRLVESSELVNVLQEFLRRAIQRAVSTSSSLELV